MTNTNTTEFKCVCCKHTLSTAEMTTDARSFGWCVECDEYEKEAARRDDANARDGAPTGWHDDLQWDD